MDRAAGATSALGSSRRHGTSSRVLWPSANRTGGARDSIALTAAFPQARCSAAAGRPGVSTTRPFTLSTGAPASAGTCTTRRARSIGASSRSPPSASCRSATTRRGSRRSSGSARRSWASTRFPRPSSSRATTSTTRTRPARSRAAAASASGATITRRRSGRASDEQLADVGRRAKARAPGLRRPSPGGLR